MDINQVWPEWYEDCVLGEGSFGKVYRAKRVEYGRTFYSAIKVLSVPKNAQEIRHARDQGLGDAEIYSYFKGLVEDLLNEITLMDNLKGAKNIVGIEDYKIIEREGEIGWEIFIRMELLTPFDNFASNPQFSQIDVLKLGVDICTALENCEQNHIVHRDIKPDNIFVSRFGEYKLGDFGIARKMEASQANLSKKGTLNYMAPEIYRGEGYGPNVDIYSLGLVLYTLLNNKRIAFLPPYPQPITYNDNENALYQRLSGVPIPLPYNASPDLASVILKACAYNPAERYQTATEFKNALITEWNRIHQTGTNFIIGNVSDSDALSGNRGTTNDMSINGRVVAGGNSDSSGAYDYSNQPVDNSIYSGKGRLGMPGIYKEKKGNKIARIISIVMAVASIVLSGIAVSSEDGGLLTTIAFVCCFAMSLIEIASDCNKKAIGICQSLLSSVFLIPSAVRLFGTLNEGFPIESLILFVCGLLVLFGGIVKIAQKVDRLSASLGIYAAVIYVIYNVYLAINNNLSIDMMYIASAVSVLTSSVWSFGSSRKTDMSTVERIIHIVTYIIAAVAAVIAAVLIARCFSAIQF